jgi:hypothetical protein
MANKTPHGTKILFDILAARGQKYLGTDERLQALTQTKYVRRCATVLLPLDFTVYYHDGNFPGQLGREGWKIEP